MFLHRLYLATASRTVEVLAQMQMKLRQPKSRPTSRHTITEHLRAMEGLSFDFWVSYHDNGGAWSDAVLGEV